MKGISFLKFSCLEVCLVFTTLKALTESFHKGCQTYFSLDSVRKKLLFLFAAKENWKKRKGSLQLEEANEC